MQVQKDIYQPLTYFERRAALRGTLAGLARDLVRLAAEKRSPTANGCASIATPTWRRSNSRSSLPLPFTKTWRSPS